MTVTHERLTELLRYDPSTDEWRFATARAGRKAGTLTAGIPSRADDYRHIMVDGKIYLAHRLVWFWHHREWPAGDIDHINRNRHDNRISNLRVVSKQQNSWNCKPRCRTASGMRGASKYGKRWLASISINGRAVRLGVYDTPEEASAAYCDAVSRHRGIPNAARGRA